MSATNSSTGSEAHKPSTPITHTFEFCDNSEVKGMKKVVIQGRMHGLSPFQRAKLLSSEARVCVAYRDGKQLMVLKEDVNSAILYQYCPQLRNFYSCCKEAGPTVILPNTENFSLVSVLGIDWVIGSFVHEVSHGTRSFYKAYVPSHSDPKQLFHAAAAFRALGLPRFAEDLVAPDHGVLSRSLARTARNIKSPKSVGKWIHSLKNDPMICQADLELLVVAYKVFAKRTAGYGNKKAENSK